MPDNLGNSIERSAERLGVGRTTMYQKIASGEIESVKIGRRRIVPEEALQAYLQRLLAEQRSGGGEAA